MDQQNEFALVTGANIGTGYELVKFLGETESPKSEK
jgi:hypothetical protein